MEENEKEQLPERGLRNENPAPAEESERKEEKKEKHAKGKHKKEDRAEKLEEEVAQLNDKYLRLYSEFDNYRKRTLREKVEWSRIAASDVISAILPVVDDLERAYSSIDPVEESHSATKEGLGLILNKLTTILSQQGLEPIKAVGEEFNTDFHEAITRIPAPSPDMVGKVVDVIEKGYTLRGKVVRFAKVVVGS